MKLSSRNTSRPSSTMVVLLVTLLSVIAMMSTTLVSAECGPDKPCQNGGTCHFDEDKQVNYCHCPQGTGGLYCHGTNCPLTCRNGGSCRHTEEDKLDFFCECIGGHTGDSCEIKPGMEGGTSTADEVESIANQETPSIQTLANDATKTGLSFGGKFFVALLVIGIVAVFAMFFIRRRRPSRQSTVDKNAAIHEAETYEDSVTSTGSAYGNSSGDVEDAVKSIEEQQHVSSFKQSASEPTNENLDDLEDYN